MFIWRYCTTYALLYIPYLSVLQELLLKPLIYHLFYFISFITVFILFQIDQILEFTSVWLYCTSLHYTLFLFLFLFLLMFDVVVEEFPQEERDPVYVKEGQGAVLLCVPPKAWPRTYSSSCLIERKVSLVKMTITTCLYLYRGSNLPLDLQWVPSFPAHRLPSVCLPEDWELVHCQSGSSGCRKLFLFCF